MSETLKLLYEGLEQEQARPHLVNAFDPERLKGTLGIHLAKIEVLQKYSPTVAALLSLNSDFRNATLDRNDISTFDNIVNHALTKWSNHRDENRTSRTITEVLTGEGGAF